MTGDDTATRSRVSARHVGLTALAGVLATLALWRAPWWGAVPPLLYPPYIPIDLRLVLPTLSFVSALYLTAYASWPAPAAGIPGMAVLTATTAHLHASAALSFAEGIPWAQPGVRIDLIGLAGSLGMLLLALLVGLEIARDRLTDRLADKGVTEEDRRVVEAHGSQLATTSIAIAGLAGAILALTLRIADQFLGRQRLPVPELFALGIVLALGAVFLGWRGRRPSGL